MGHCRISLTQEAAALLLMVAFTIIDVVAIANHE